MCSGNFIRVLAVTLTIISLYVCTAETPCTANGWFSPNCQYQCHCAGSAPCDKHDGSCSSGCHQNWFGPACQYARMSFTTSGGESWLTDNDDTTCNTGNTQSVTVTLNTSIPLTWVRVVVRDAVHLDQIQLSYQLSGSSTPLACPVLRKAKVDNQTLDIECFTPQNVSGLSLSGSGVKGLCSLYISGGRNVALKQTARQSSRYIPGGAPDSFKAENAVDGVLPGDTVESARSTCTHTLGIPDTQDPGWWTVTFSQVVDVTRLLIYNRVDCGQACKDRLVGFTLTAQFVPSPATLYSYTDPGGPGHASYTVVPSPRISFPVSLVRFDTANDINILTLCEVLVFGETDCRAGQYGLRCERQCNCANNESCFVHSGRCPSGCATGYTGEDCSECQTGRYGNQCKQSCSATCGGDNSCNKITGACIQGCDPGYLGTTCTIQCPTGKYGLNCSEFCSPNCRGSNNACNHEDGTCTNGCEDGYRGDRCDTECQTGRYGNQCKQSCSATCGGDNSCDRINGACIQGCDPGYLGTTCGIQCPTGKYGLNCSESCSPNCRGADNACNHEDGTCTNGCEDGYRGDRCDTDCDPGTYGAECPGRCSVNCAGPDNACDHFTGTCDVGCDSGYYGALCLNPCSSNCGGPDNACNRASGVCDTCKPGFYEGFCSSLCSSKCGGPDNACDRVTGACSSCPPGFMGAGCDQKCPNGSYGEECTKTCSDHCAGDQNSCHHVNGTCDLGCEPGYQGSSCTQVCPRGRYGSGCTQACSVQCAGRESPCDHVDGSCYFGCKQDDNSFICRSAALTGDESDDSGVKTWAVVATIVAGVALIVAAVAIGILVRRTHKVYTDGSSTSAERGNNSENETCAAFHRDEDRQKPVQQRMDENEGSDHYNESMESGRGDVHRYDTDFDHYDRPENLMKESGVYENQLSG